MSTLGCAQDYSVALYYRGGERLFAQLTGVSAVEWTRVLNDTSTASVTISLPGAGGDCVGLLKDVWPWGFELWIYRDGQCVWQGPIINVRFRRDTAVIEAHDVVGLLDYRTNQNPYYYWNWDVSHFAYLIAHDCLNYDDPNIIDYITQETAGVNAERSADAQAIFAADEFRDLVKYGLDFTTIGRRLILRGQTPANNDAPIRLGEDDISGDIEVSRDGRYYASYIIGQANGMTANAPYTRPVPAFTGAVDTMQKFGGAMTDWGVLNAATWHSYWNVRNIPLVVTIPQNSQLATTAPVTLDQLVCGWRIDISLAWDIPVHASTKLTRVKGTWSGGKEVIAISVVSLSPAGVIPDPPA